MIISYLPVPDKETTEPEGPVPTITVETTEGDELNQAKKRKESRVPSAKKKQEIPELGVEVKGSVQRKVGWPGKWEKSWCVVTYNGIYFTSTEENKDYSHFVPILPESKNSVQKKKGHANHPGLIIKVAGKKEHISFESASEATQWHEKLEQILGIAGVEELASEDEEEDEGPALDEG